MNLQKTREVGWFVVVVDDVVVVVDVEVGTGPPPSVVEVVDDVEVVPAIIVTLNLLLLFARLPLQFAYE